MKYFALMALLAAPIAIAATPTPADAAPRDGYRCKMIKKTIHTKFGKKHTRWVKVCRPAPRRHHHH